MINAAAALCFKGKIRRVFDESRIWPSLCRLSSSLPVAGERIIERKSPAAAAGESREEPDVKGEGLGIKGDGKDKGGEKDEPCHEGEDESIHSGEDPEQDAEKADREDRNTANGHDIRDRQAFGHQLFDETPVPGVPDIVRRRDKLSPELVIKENRKSDDTDNEQSKIAELGFFRSGVRQWLKRHGLKTSESPDSNMVRGFSAIEITGFEAEGFSAGGGAGEKFLILKGRP